MFEKILAEVRDALSGIKAFLGGNFVPKAELEAANVKLAELTEKNATLESKASELSTASVQLATITTERDSLKSEVETLKAEAKTVDQAAAVKAQEICAAQGIPAAKVPESTTTTISSDAAELEKTRAQIQTEKDPAKRFQLAARCRVLRGHGDLFKN